MASSNPTQQIKACLKDDASYKANRKPIIQQIANGNRVYITALVDTCKTVLKNKKEPAMSKFICLYFLKEAMDVKDPSLADYVKDKILKRLCDIAKSSPSEILGSKADSNIVKNFYQLLLEELYFWGEWFGKDSRGKSTKYKTSLDDVANHVKMPQKAMFFKDRTKKSTEDKKSSESQSKSSKPEPEASSDKRRASLTVPKKEEHKSQQSSRTPEGGASGKAPSTRKIVQDLQVLNEQKDFMVAVLTSDESPDPETLGAIYEQIKDSDQRMQNHVQEIFNMPDFAEKENLVNKIMEGTAFTSTYIQEHQRLQNGDIGLPQFKTIILQQTVGSRESPEKPSKKEAAPKQSKREEIPVPPKSKFNTTAAQPQKRTDFEVNFNSVNVPQPQSGQPGGSSSPFDNFQSTPAMPSQGRNSNAFDEFDSGAKIPANNNNAFSAFETAPARPSEQHHDAFSAQNQFDAYNNSHPDSGQPQPQGHDAFNQFNTAPQASNFDQHNNNFGEFNTFQEAPKQRRFSNQPEDDFGRFDQYNKNLDSNSNRPSQLQEREYAPQPQEVVHYQEPVVQASFQPKVELPEMAALRGERKKHEEEEKTYNNQQQYDNDGFGMDAFDDFDTRNEPKDQESSGFDFDYAGGGNKRKAGTPHSVGSHGNIFDDPHARRDSFRKEFGQDDPAFDTNFGQGIDENVRNSFNTNQHQHQPEPQTGAFGTFNEQHQQQDQAWAHNAFDSFNKQPEPPAQTNDSQQQQHYQQQQQQDDFGRFDNGTKRTSHRGTFESPNAGAAQRETSMLSASQTVANNRVQAKFGDMESERLRKERDRILSELENVKRMYSGMKIEYDYMKQNHDSTSTDYNKVRTELDDLRRHRGQLNFSNDQLRTENEAFRKFRGTLATENDGHLRLFEDMSKELSAIKQKVNEFDVDDQKLRNGSRLVELESSLRNAQLKVESMHNLNRTVNTEFNQVNNEFDRYRQNQFTESTFSPRRELFGSTALHPVPTSLDPNNAYQSPPRQRSKSPQIVDLLSLERPHLVASRTSPNRLRSPIRHQSPPPLRSSYRAGDLGTSLAQATPFDLMNGDLPTNTFSQPYRPSVGGGLQGFSEYKYSDPLTTSQLNRQVSPPRYNSGLNPQPATSNFSNLIGFVPKYSDIPPINPSDAIPSNLSAINVANNHFSSSSSLQGNILNLPSFPTNTAAAYSSVNIQPTNNNPLGYPSKYSSQSAGLHSDFAQPTTNGGFDTLKRQGVASTMTYSVAISQPNSGSKKAVDLIEKARRMREGVHSGTNSIVGGGAPANYGSRDSVHNRPSVSSVNRNLAEDFILPPPVIGNTNTMQQAGQFGGRLSPTRTRTSPIRANVVSPRKSVSSPGRDRLQSRPPLVQTQEYRGRTLGSTAIHGEYGLRTDNYTSSIGGGQPTNIVTELDSHLGGLPEGLYRGSPIRERVVNRSEMIELKPTESLRIVERVIGKSPSQKRERSPVPKGVKTTTSTTEHRKIFDSKPQTNQRLAETLKSDFEMIKRSLDVGRYGVVSASLNNPLEIAENFQQNTTRKQNEIYGRGTSPSYVPDEMANASKMLRMYSQDQPISNKLTETLKRGEVRNSSTLYRDDLRIRTSNVGPGILESAYNGKEVRQMGGGPPVGVRLTAEDNYFQGTSHSRGFSQDLNNHFARNNAITEGLITQYNLTGKKIKPKNGKRIDFDHTFFDTFSNAIYGNPYFRDIDSFKNACLVSRANLFETHLLQISSITRNESPVGPNDEILKVIIHYTNKSLMDVVDFTAYPLEHSVQYVPQIQGGALTSKYQLKQEFFVSFFDLRNVPYIVNVSYKQEGSTKQMDVVLPITINKYMKFRHGIAKNVFKDTWKQIKFGVTTTGYKNINSKFVRTHAELNKYFENNLIDISPQINAKNKKKYGGVFTLPDNREYYLKITLDNSRLKVAVACGIGQGGYEEKIAQFLTFLFTV